MQPKSEQPVTARRRPAIREQTWVDTALFGGIFLGIAGICLEGLILEANPVQPMGAYAYGVKFFNRIYLNLPEFAVFVALSVVRFGCAITLAFREFILPGPPKGLT